MSVKWSKKFEIGMTDIDTQHKALIDAMIEFHNSVQSGDSAKRVKDLMTFMENYIFEHLRTEEAYQIKYNYPDYKNHKSIHENFKVKLQAIRTEVIENPASLKLALKIQRELIDWFVNHIQITDKKLGKFLHKKIC